MITLRAGLFLVLMGGLQVGCYTPPSQGQLDAARNSDGNRDSAVDGSNDQDAAQVDAGPGLPSLARAPKTCEVTVTVAEPIVQLTPSWKGAVSASSMQGLTRTFFQCNEVWAVFDRFSIQTRPMGTEPSIVLKRTDVIADQTVAMAYTVEGIEQLGEVEAAFAGGFILSASPTQFSVASIQRDPISGISSLVVATQDGIVSTLALGNPAPPYRVRWSSVRTGDQLAMFITIDTSTTTQHFPAQVMPLPSTDLILQIGVNRYKGGQGTKMTISDLELP